MGDYSMQRVLALLAIVFVLIVQCQSITTYKCTNQMNDCGCSRRPHISLKMHGGQSALFSNWDWIVSIRNSDNHFCAGSVLNEWYIVTVAHCFENITDITSEITVCAGTFRLSDPCHQRRTIDSVTSHPLYNTTTNENDIALVRLTTPLDLSDSSITPICLPSADYPDEYPALDEEVVSIGWGNLKSNRTPDALQEVTLKIMDSSSIFCSHLDNHRLQICAGSYGKGISKGDSGGPLMYLTASKKWELIGLASFTKMYRTALSGSGYTRIIPYLNFIKAHTQKPSIDSAIINCSCQCPRGFNSGYAYSTINFLDGCVNACMADSSNTCMSSNTYACLETDCAYSKSYNVTTTVPIHDNQSPIVYSVVIHPNGNKYEGQTKDGKMHGQGAYTWSSGDQYIGSWVENQRTGTGIYTWSDGDVYKGQFLDNKRHGQGTYIFANGNTYVGEWLDNTKTGKGIWTSSDGLKYIGDWLNDLMTGKGTLTSSISSTYTGDWIDGSKTGKGTFTWLNGDTYTGDWIDDIRTGNGIMTSFNGDKYEGQFKNDKKHGQGTRTSLNGDIYTGNWVEDSMAGEGIYTWFNGDKYEGRFKNGTTSGMGKMYYTNGTIISGLWPSGPFVYS